jgi:hypothetical protein
MLAIAQGRIGDSNYGRGEDHKGQQLELGHSCSPLRARIAIECNAKVQSIQVPTPNSMIQIGVVLYPGIAKNTAESGVSTPTARQAVDARSSALANSFVCSLSTSFIFIPSETCSLRSRPLAPNSGGYPDLFGDYVLATYSA